MSTATTIDPDELTRVVEGCVTPLRRVATYELPASLASRMHELGERKEFLSAAERDELTALVEFWRQRTVEKL